MSEATIRIVDQLIYSYLNRRQYKNSLDAFLSESTIVHTSSTRTGKETSVVESSPTVHGKNLEEIIEGFSQYGQPNLPWSFYEFATKIRTLANDYSTLCDQTYSISSLGSAAGFTNCSQQQAVPSRAQPAMRSVSNMNLHQLPASQNGQELHSQEQVPLSCVPGDTLSRDSQVATSSNGPDSSMHNVDGSNICSLRKQPHPSIREDASTFKTIEMLGSKPSSVVNANLHQDSSHENADSKISQLSMDVDGDILDLFEDLVQYNPFPFMDDGIRNDQALANFPDPGPATSSQSCMALDVLMTTPSKSQLHNSTNNDSYPPLSRRATDDSSMDTVVGEQQKYEDIHSVSRDPNSVDSSSVKMETNASSTRKKLPLADRPQFQNLTYHEAQNVTPVTYPAQNSGANGLSDLFGDEEMEESQPNSRRNSSASTKSCGRVLEKPANTERERNEDYNSRTRTDTRSQSTRPAPHKDIKEKRSTDTNAPDYKQKMRNKRSSRDSSPRRSTHSDASRSTRDFNRDRESKRREEAMKRKRTEERKRNEYENRKRREKEAERINQMKEDSRRQNEEEVETRRLEELRKRDLQSQDIGQDEELQKEIFIDKELSRIEQNERAEKRRIKEEGKLIRQGATVGKKKSSYDNKKLCETMRKSHVTDQSSRKNSTVEEKPCSSVVPKQNGEDILSKIGIELDSGWGSDHSYNSLPSTQRNSAMQSMPRIPKLSHANSPSDPHSSSSQSVKVPEQTVSHSGRSSRNSSMSIAPEPILSSGIPSKTETLLVITRRNPNMIGMLMESWKPGAKNQPVKSRERTNVVDSYPDFSKSSIKTEKVIRSDEVGNASPSTRQDTTRPAVATDFSALLTTPGKQSELVESIDIKSAPVTNLVQGDDASPPKKKKKVDFNKAHAFLNKIHRT